MSPRPGVLGWSPFLPFENGPWIRNTAVPKEIETPTECPACIALCGVNFSISQSLLTLFCLVCQWLFCLVSVSSSLEKEKVSLCWNPGDWSVMIDAELSTAITVLHGMNYAPKITYNYHIESKITYKFSKFCSEDDRMKPIPYTGEKKIS